MSGGESDSSSPSSSPARPNGTGIDSPISSASSLNFVILADGNIGESDESIHVVSPKMRPKFRPNVRTHKFKKKSAPDLATLSSTSLASIPEGETTDMDLSNTRSSTLPSFSHPVVTGKFTFQNGARRRFSDEEPSKQNGHTGEVSEGIATAESLQNGVVTFTKNSTDKTDNNKVDNSKPSDIANCDRKNHLASYTPTIQQLQKLEIVSQSSLWSSQQSQLSDGVISMLNLVQEEQTAATMRDVIEEEIKKSSNNPQNHETNAWVQMLTATRDMVESSDETIEVPENIHTNWILKNT